MFDQVLLYITSNKQHIESFLFVDFYHIACFPILVIDVVNISNHYCDKYFSISAWLKSVVPGGAKFEEKYNTATEETYIDGSDEIDMVEIF